MEEPIYCQLVVFYSIVAIFGPVPSLLSRIQGDLGLRLSQDKETVLQVLWVCCFFFFKIHDIPGHFAISLRSGLLLYPYNNGFSAAFWMTRNRLMYLNILLVKSYFNQYNKNELTDIFKKKFYQSK